MKLTSQDSSSLSIVLAVLMGGVGGCAQTHDCGSAETCDYFDNDCDGPVDEHTLAMQVVGGEPQELLYATKDDCGACGLSCDAVFPGAEETACVYDDVLMALRCELVGCPEGTRKVDAACVPLVPYACLSCEDDADCTWAAEDAICRGGRCTDTCATPSDCVHLSAETGFAFDCVEGACEPSAGCACNEKTVGLQAACLLENASGDLCAGEQVCDVDGFFCVSTRPSRSVQRFGR